MTSVSTPIVSMRLNGNNRFGRFCFVLSLLPSPLASSRPVRLVPFNQDVYVETVCILLEQSRSQSHLTTEEQQQKTKIDRANLSNRSMYACRCDTRRHGEKRRSFLLRLYTQVLLLLEHYLDRVETSTRGKRQKAREKRASEREKINPNPLQVRKKRERKTRERT